MKLCEDCHGSGSWCSDEIKDCLFCGGAGWLPFWSPAERAGLKAMGEEFKINRDHSYKECSLGTVDAICAYVQAARKSKERR